MNAVAVRTRAGGTDLAARTGRASGRLVLLVAWILVVALAATLVLLSVRAARSKGMQIAPGRSDRSIPTPVVIPGPH